MIAKRGVLVFLTAAVLNCAAAPSVAEVPPPALQEAISPCVVTVAAYDARESLLFQGSGFFISESGDVITSYRNLQGSYAVKVIMPDGSILPVTAIVDEKPELDLVRMSTRTDGRGVPCSPPVTAAARVGERIFIFGNSLLHGGTATRGMVTAIREVPLLGQVLEITAPLTAIMRGGPVVNTSGQVIGVAVSGNISDPDRHSQHYAMPASRLSGPWDTARSRMILPNLKRTVLGERTPQEEMYIAGMHLLWAGEYLAARSIFLQVLEDDPDMAEAYVLFGFSAGRTGRHHEVAEAYGQALRRNPRYTSLHYGLGMAYEKLRCYQDAAESYERVTRLDPDDFRAYYKLGYAYSRLGWQEEATDTFKRAIAQRCGATRPDSAACAEENLVSFTEMIDAFRKYGSNGNGDGDIYYQRGLAYIMLSRMDLAMDEYEGLKSLDPRKAARLRELIAP